jgi:hypothetical protein
LRTAHSPQSDQASRKSGLFAEPKSGRQTSGHSLLHSGWRRQKSSSRRTTTRRPYILISKSRALGMLLRKLEAWEEASARPEWGGERGGRGGFHHGG